MRAKSLRAIRVLVLEDDPSLRELLKYNLDAEGYSVELAARGDEFELKLLEMIPDLMILDWMLPDKSGIEICRQLRARENTKNVPIIMLTARGEESDRVRGLTIGADDYIVKPFSVPELIARVQVLLRRMAPERIAGRLVFGDLELNRENFRVRRGGREIHLGPTEFRLLEHFMSKPGRVYTRSQLLDAIWGHSSEIDERTVDVHVGRLRKLLCRGKEEDPIRTVRGAGYGLNAPYSKD